MMGIIDKIDKRFSLRDAALGVNMNDMEQAVNMQLRGGILNALGIADKTRLALAPLKINSRYTGPCMTVRRTSDSTTADILFRPGTLKWDRWRDGLFNCLSNPDGRYGTVGVASYGGVLSNVSGGFRNVGGGASTYQGIRLTKDLSVFPSPVGGKYSVKITINAPADSPYVSLVLYNGTTIKNVNVKSLLTLGQDTTITVDFPVLTDGGSSNAVRFYAEIGWPDAATANGKVLDVKNVSLIYRGESASRPYYNTPVADLFNTVLAPYTNAAGVVYPFGLMPGEMDLDQLMAFVGSASGYVTRWFDQGYDAVRSKNLVESFASLSGAQYYPAVCAFADLKPDTTYALSLIIPSGEQYYLNENLFTWANVPLGDGTRKTIIVTTLPNISTSNSNQSTPGYGWLLLKNSTGYSSSGTASQLQIELGNTATEYIPKRGNTALQATAGYQPRIVNAGVPDFALMPYFDGTDDRMSIPNAASLDIVSAPLTIWGRGINQGNLGYFLARNGANPERQYYVYREAGSSSVRFGINDTDDKSPDNSNLANSVCSLGGAWDGANVNPIANKTLTAGAAKTGALTSRVNTTIGAASESSNGSSMGNFWKGNIGMVELATVNPTQAQLDRLG